MATASARSVPVALPERGGSDDEDPLDSLASATDATGMVTASSRSIQALFADGGDGKGRDEDDDDPLSSLASAAAAADQLLHTAVPAVASDKGAGADGEGLTVGAGAGPHPASAPTSALSEEEARDYAEASAIAAEELRRIHPLIRSQITSTLPPGLWAGLSVFDKLGLIKSEMPRHDEDEFTRQHIARIDTAAPLSPSTALPAASAVSSKAAGTATDGQAKRSLAVATAAAEDTTEAPRATAKPAASPHGGAAKDSKSCPVSGKAGDCPWSAMLRDAQTELGSAEDKRNSRLSQERDSCRSQ